MTKRTVHDDSHRPGLRKPQFTLVGLLLGMTLFALLLVTFKTAGPIPGLVLLLAALAVLAHVAGNALGTQLRDSTNEVARRASSSNKPPAQPHHFARTTRLAERMRMGWPMIVLTGLCAAAGAYFGGNLLAEINAAELTRANLTVAFVSCGVLGAILGFGLSMFFKVAIDAWWQAHQHD